MNALELIRKKKLAQTLSDAEISFLIEGYTQGHVTDYQMAAWAMAVCWQGMTVEETAALTLALVNSGERVDLSAIPGVKVDKHSTGGVGDTTTLVLAPLVASLGVPVAKLSGRGLGHTGGTVDKLEAIPGFSMELTTDRFIALVQEQQLALASQTQNLTPADKQLYALRDVTATVDSVPLIASSIMSKKIASGADAIVLDVKMGGGSLMGNPLLDISLAESMVDIGKQLGRRTVAVISDMNQPLGYAIGNGLEVEEAISTLRGMGPTDLTELCLVLGAQMLLLAGRCQNESEARQLLITSIREGRALAKFRQFIASQGGDAAVCDQPHLLPQSQWHHDVTALEGGFLQSIDAAELGRCAQLLGAGRLRKEDVIDPAVGLKLGKKVGERVEAGERLVTIYANDNHSLAEVEERLRRSFVVGPVYKPAPPLIRQVI